MKSCRYIKTFESFQEAPVIDEVKAVADSKPNIYRYVITSDDTNGVSITVRGEDGTIKLDLSDNTFGKGIMAHKDDLAGLRKHMVEKKLIREIDQIEKA